MSAAELGTAYHRAIAAALETIHGHADAIASEHHLSNATALAVIWGGVSAHFTPATLSELDGRTARWRCRFRFYRADHMDEPEADTDAELAADQPGATVLAGLPAVAHEAIMLANQLHPGMTLRGLSREEIDRKMRGIRPTLSRRGGNAVWRLPYDTLESFNEKSHVQGWLCRVDIQREESVK